MRRHFYTLLSIALLYGSLAGAQTLTVSLSGNHCIGDTMKITSNIKPEKIVWKYNGNLVDSVFAGWRRMGIRVAGTVGETIYNDDSSCYAPHGVYVDAGDTLYVVEAGNQRVQKWAPGAIKGVTVAGTSGVSGIGANQFNSPIGLWMDTSGNMFIGDMGNNRVQKWAKGAATGTTVAGSSTGAAGNSTSLLSGPWGVYVTPGDTVYVLDRNNNRVQKWAPGASSGTTVAGNGTYGSGANQLAGPIGIFVDANRNVYIADNDNHRIQKWAPGASTGITVAGSHVGNIGSADSLLYGPQGVYVDGNGYLYICDAANHKVVRWAPGATSGRTIAGDSAGSIALSDSLMYNPDGICLDVNGNMFVADVSDERVMKYTDTIILSKTSSAAGVYTAVVTTFGGITDSATITINNFVVPSVSIATSPLYPKAGDAITYTATVTNGGTAPTYQWRKNGADISGATTNPYITSSLANGDVISVLVHSNAQCANPDSAKTSAGPLGIAETINATKNVLFPNPNNGQFNLAMQLTNTGNGLATIQVLNMLGEVVYNSDAVIANGWVNKTVTLNGKITDGIYILRLNGNDEVKNIRFTIAH